MILKKKIAMLGVFLDTETNGLNSKRHRILDIAYIIVDLCSKKEVQQYQTLICPTEEVWAQSDLDSLKVNGFTWNEVKKGKSEKNVKEHIINSFNTLGIKRKEAVYICQNPSFDRNFFSLLIDPDIQESLNWPYHWLDLASMYWATTIKKAMETKSEFPWDTGFSKDLIASNLGLPPEKKPHRAMNGVKHLITCYEAVVGFPYQTKN